MQVLAIDVAQWFQRQEEVIAVGRGWGEIRGARAQPCASAVAIDQEVDVEARRNAPL
jgi:hypothetical protein